MHLCTIDLVIYLCSVLTAVRHTNKKQKFASSTTERIFVGQVERKKKKKLYDLASFLVTGMTSSCRISPNETWMVTLSVPSNTPDAPACGGR